MISPASMVLNTDNCHAPTGDSPSIYRLLALEKVWGVTPQVASLFRQKVELLDKG